MKSCWVPSTWVCVSTEPDAHDRTHGPHDKEYLPWARHVRFRLAVCLWGRDGPAAHGDLNTHRLRGAGSHHDATPEFRILSSNSPRNVMGMGSGD